MRLVDLGDLAECRTVADAAVALGNFDGVHLGHRRLFDALGDDLPRAVFTFSDLKQHDLLCTLDEKLRLIAACSVEYAYIVDFAEVRDLSAADFARRLALDLHVRRAVCGFNFTFGAGGNSGAADLCRLLAPYDVETVVVDSVAVDGETVSSTAIRRRLCDGDALGAAELLGRPFGYTLPVIHGRALGREMGYPTLNQRIPDCLLVPRFGVYASFCTVEGEAMPAVTNIGVRPTVGGDFVCVETHVLGFDGDLYGKSVTVELRDFIRPEHRFDSVEALFTRVAEDAAEAKRILSRITK